ncbi:MAG: hypothetical protein ABEH64_06860 [Salinirussus sp.]
MNLGTKLRNRDTPVRVGVIGAGIFGSQVIHAAEATPGLEISAIADIDRTKAETSFRRIGVADDAIHTVDDGADLDAVLESGQRALTTDGRVVVGADVDVIVDATGDPNVAAVNGYRSLMAGTHFVNVSVEADTVCGPALAAIANRNDVTYTLAYGDQPGKIVELCEWAWATGFEVVAAGRSARVPTRHGKPDDALDRHPFVTAFGEDLEPNPVMYNTFMDGTKEAVESVAAANALGLSIDERGLHRPEIRLEDMPETFRPRSEGGLLGTTGVIDSVAPTDANFSVFVVTRTSSEQLIDYYGHRPSITTSEDGVYQVFYIPSHFAPETTRSIASAALLNEPTGAPRGHHAEVVAGAKRELTPGDEIDGGGGSTVYGVATSRSDAETHGYVPFELLEGAEVVQPVETDELITREDVDFDRDQPMNHLRGVQNF